MDTYRICTYWTNENTKQLFKEYVMKLHIFSYGKHVPIDELKIDQYIFSCITYMLFYVYNNIK